MAAARAEARLASLRGRPPRGDRFPCRPPVSSMHASFVTNLPDDGSALRPIELVSTYHGVNYNAGPDLTEVLGMAATERLKVGAGAPPAPQLVKGLTERPLALPALQERT